MSVLSSLKRLGPPKDAIDVRNRRDHLQIRESPRKCECSGYDVALYLRGVAVDDVVGDVVVTEW